MNVLTLISRSLRRGPLTLRFPDRAVPAPDFRGLVRIDTGKCIACGICDYVCVSGAITVTDHATHCDWKYDPGLCTFCGRCVGHCPGEALSQEGDRAPVYVRSGALDQMARIDYPPCPQCGLPARPYNERLLAVAHEQISREFRERVRLCERCRQRRAQTLLKKGYGGDAEPEGNNDGR